MNLLNSLIKIKEDKNLINMTKNISSFVEQSGTKVLIFKF